ncbi:hypothetical protein MNBD_NITROSPINAE01-171 [hydrothermal vent metagenome]|uniref:HTH marR-type domain-containing protein n=1 Tax=hydrothermal vent metagenome TaxID=652676 RepID=A0A3B1BUV5_9ZZZZ
MQPTTESGLVGKLVDTIVDRYREIESSQPLLNRELSGSERRALKAVSSAGRSMTISEVGAAIGTPPSTTTWIVGGLVKRGVFKRSQDKHDKRKVWIKLGQKGEALARLLERIPDRIAADLLYKLSPEQRSTFVELVRTAMKKIEEAGSFK